MYLRGDSFDDALPLPIQVVPLRHLSFVLVPMLPQLEVATTFPSRKRSDITATSI